ncbi:unnamed protein product [Psylliodes chrysocephalus]|uniref:Medium-chain acyl-CoA ligase ACSF2, mitochondrial n=1 Tax=Psylliodes chrysocephalus TaxID=3402493 RepID=A0A9P0CP99_9CUCU|nr:unnamed protein product [Psylliodes chrysocephala]
MMCSVVQVEWAKMGKIGRIFLGVNKTYRMQNFSTKQSYYHRTSDFPLKPVTLGQLAEIASYKYGDRPAIISCHQKKQVTFGEVLEEADRLAAGFANLGLQRGDKIGLWAPNLVEWYLAYVACARGGFVAVLMNPFYQPQEVEQMIKKVGIKSLICGDTFRKQNYYNILNEVCPEIAHCKPGKISSQKVPSLQHVVMITDDSKKGTFKYSDILDLADEDSIKMVKKNQNKINMDDPCNIQFTSGTTGNPKAPVQSHFNIVNCGYFCGMSVGLHKKHQKICMQNPFFHVFGTVVAISSSINHGSTIVLPSDGYDPEKNLTAIVEEECNVIFGTPTMYVDLVAVQKKRNEKNIKVEIALSGGALCPPALFRDMMDVIKVKKVMSVYGLTEITAAVFFSTENDSEYQELNTVGKLQEHVEVKVVDTDGHIVPYGVPGELHVRGFSTMLGYYKDKTKTNEMIDSNGWVHTGDQFILTEDGYGQVVGRLKDVIIKGGENIYPKEIEEHLLTHPDILIAYVVGLPHERLGEEVCACIKTRDGIQLTVEEIRQYCRDKIFNFGIPSVVEIMDSFPTTVSGKVQKHKIVENLVRNKLQK